MTKDIKEEIKEKLDYIGLNLDKVPKYLKEFEQVNFRPNRMYDETTYKTYKYVDLKEIEILITPYDRLQDVKDKYKNAVPLAEYLEPTEENSDKNMTFLKMLENLSIERLKELEKEQELLNEKIPYEIRYKDNFVWQIYYSDSTNKYFMLFPTNETRTESLFYIIMKKIQTRRTKKKETIYVPICNAEYSNLYLKKTEIADLENYLWIFTGEWANVYEVEDKDGNKTLQIVGQTTVYDKIKSKYKIKLNNKEEAQNEYKLIKALFILQSYNEELYDFKTTINEQGSLDFCYNLRKIKYENLSDFILGQVNNKLGQANGIYEKLLFEEERLSILKQAVEKQNIEFANKEKQIVMFLECKKTFFGRMKYFFKGKKQTKEEKIAKVLEEKMQKQDDKEEKEISEIAFVKKEFYTIEDLLHVCKILEDFETKYKNVEMDIRALENKKENLERKIKNATQYINEIESHKKSIFDFWKFTSKDEVTLLNESELKEENKQKKIKKVFDYEEDLEDFGKHIDDIQRSLISKNECDSIFAIKNDLESFNIIGKDKILKKDDTQIQKALDKQKAEYEKNIEQIRQKDFDIFGNVIEDKTKIKVLKNTKHREIEKDKYKILNIKPSTTLEEYKDNIKNYYQLLKESYGKIATPYDMELYKIDTDEIKDSGFDIFSINPEMEIENNLNNESVVKLLKIDIKENMPVIFYSNIMFYDNLNGTLPLGMDISTEVLINLDEFEVKLVARKDFNINMPVSKFENEIKTVQVYEYDVERKVVSK